MDRMEKSANMGLVALAVSDVIVCLVYLLNSVVDDSLNLAVADGSVHRVTLLYFHAYKEPLLNIALLTSTWLTVTMAVGRYFAVCRPLHARGQISLLGTRLTLLGVLVGSVFANLPRFWHYRVLHVACPNLEPGHNANSAFARCECFYIVKQTGWLYTKPTFVFVYRLCCSFVTLFAPLPILTACNVRLVQALRNSRRLQKLCRANKSTADEKHKSSSQHRITPTLIGLIVLFLVLVGPSEVLSFFRDHVSIDGYKLFDVATVVTNFLQLINFAVNFVLYCVVNAQFRRTCQQLLTCSTFHGQRGHLACELDTAKISHTLGSTTRRTTMGAQGINDELIHTNDVIVVTSTV